MGRAGVDHSGGQGAEKSSTFARVRGENTSPLNVSFSVNTAERSRSFQGRCGTSTSARERERVSGPGGSSGAYLRSSQSAPPYFISAGEQLLEST